MDEKDVIERLGPPDEIVGRKDRMRSLGWVCSAFRSATAFEVPMPCPAPCCRCGGIAFETVAQPVDLLKAPTGRSAEDVKEIKERIAFWLKTCLADWDGGTHMSKGEWRTTCNRVATERGAFMQRGGGGIAGSRS